MASQSEQIQHKLFLILNTESLWRSTFRLLEDGNGHRFCPTAAQLTEICQLLLACFQSRMSLREICILLEQNEMAVPPIFTLSLWDVLKQLDPELIHNYEASVRDRQMATLASNAEPSLCVSGAPEIPIQFPSVAQQPYHITARASPSYPQSASSSLLLPVPFSAPLVNGTAASSPSNAESPRTTLGTSVPSQTGGSSALIGTTPPTSASSLSLGASPSPTYSASLQSASPIGPKSKKCAGKKQTTNAPTNTSGGDPATAKRRYIKSAQNAPRDTDSDRNFSESHQLLLKEMLRVHATNTPTAPSPTASRRNSVPTRQHQESSLPPPKRQRANSLPTPYLPPNLVASLNQHESNVLRSPPAFFAPPPSANQGVPSHAQQCHWQTGTWPFGSPTTAGTSSASPNAPAAEHDRELLSASDRELLQILPPQSNASPLSPTQISDDLVSSFLLDDSLGHAFE